MWLAQQRLSSAHGGVCPRLCCTADAAGYLTDLVCDLMAPIPELFPHSVLILPGDVNMKLDLTARRLLRQAHPTSTQLITIRKVNGTRGNTAQQ
jgi:hypothetical protein